MSNQMNYNYMNSQMKNNNFNNNQMNFNNMNNQINNSNKNNQMNNNNNMTPQNNYYNFLSNTWSNYQFCNNTNNQNTHNYTNRMKLINNNTFNNNTHRLLRQNLSFNYDDDSIGTNTINIFFEASSGHKISILCNPNIKMKDLLKKYVKKIGASEDIIDDSIYFLYNGAKIKKDENKTLNELNMINCSIIIVIDKNAVVGA